MRLPLKIKYIISEETIVWILLHLKIIFLSPKYLHLPRRPNERSNCVCAFFFLSKNTIAFSTKICSTSGTFIRYLQILWATTTGSHCRMNKSNGIHSNQASQRMERHCSSWVRTETYSPVSGLILLPCSFNVLFWFYAQQWETFSPIPAVITDDHQRDGNAVSSAMKSLKCNT